jgi:hypothetical protein
MIKKYAYGHWVYYACLTASEGRTQVIDKKGQFMVNNKRLVSDSSTLKQITIHTDTTIGQRRNKNSTHEHVSRAVKQNKIETT